MLIFQGVSSNPSKNSQKFNGPQKILRNPRIFWFPPKTVTISRPGYDISCPTSSEVPRRKHSQTSTKQWQSGQGTKNFPQKPHENVQTPWVVCVQIWCVAMCICISTDMIVWMKIINSHSSSISCWITFDCQWWHKFPWHLHFRTLLTLQSIITDILSLLQMK